jgi:hypothetical protein
MVKAEDVHEPVYYQGQEPVIYGNTPAFGLFSCAFSRDHYVAENLALKTAQVRKGYDIRRRIFSEPYAVEVRDSFVICEEDAEVSIRQP